MSNIKRLVIKGTVPFDYLSKDKGLATIIGCMQGPSWGFHLEYGDCKYIPNDHGGDTATYNFKITGEEAVSYGFVSYLVLRLNMAGAIITEAKIMDMEFDPDNLQWETIEPQESQTKIIKWNGENNSLSLYENLNDIPEENRGRNDFYSTIDLSKAVNINFADFFENYNDERINNLGELINWLEEKGIVEDIGETSDIVWK